MTKTRNKDNVCPHCLSKLIDDDGIMACKGDKLQVWTKDFKRYKNMDAAEKKKFLISFSDSERFVELYEKWSFVDEHGNRPNFTCGYTNQIFNPVPETRITLPDPMQVGQIERKLKRELTEEELIGHKPIFINGKLVKLNMMVFPDDF